MRINVSIDDKLLIEFDKYCSIFNYNRSELLSKLMRDVVYNIHTDIPKDTHTLHTENIPIKKMIKNGNEIHIETGTMPVENKSIGYCSLHFDVLGKRELTLISWEDENGNLVVDKKMVCPDCVEKYKNLGRGKIL